MFFEYDGTLSRDESGYLIIYEDRRRENPLLGTNVNLTGLVGLQSKCKNHMMCGMPLHDNRCVAQDLQCSWLPRSEPVEPPRSTKLVMLSKTIINATTVQFKFKLTGPTSMRLFIQAYNDVTISNWSFLRTLIDNPPPAHMPIRINFKYANDDSPFKFFIDISVRNFYNLNHSELI